jgi:hypothetical protein
MSATRPDPSRPMRDRDRADLEMLASGITTASGSASPREVGQARVELKLRDWEYAEQQETTRRNFETALADKQLKAATDVSWATKWAAVAAAVSAFGAIIQAVVAIYHW